MSYVSFDNSTLSQFQQVLHVVSNIIKIIYMIVIKNYLSATEDNWSLIFDSPSNIVSKVSFDNSTLSQFHQVLHVVSDIIKIIYMIVIKYHLSATDDNWSLIFDSPSNIVSKVSLDSSTLTLVISGTILVWVGFSCTCRIKIDI